MKHLQYQMSRHFITTHNNSNQSIFSTSSTEKRHAQHISGTTVETVYTFSTFPPDLSSEDDIKQYDRDPGLSSDNKFAAVIGNFPPGAETPMHRTMTVNIGIVLEGTVELHLDSGEVRTMKKGDSYTQRGTMHSWKNPGEEWVRIATFTMPIAEPFRPNGKELGNDSSWVDTLNDTLSQAEVRHS